MKNKKIFFAVVFLLVSSIAWWKVSTQKTHAPAAHQGTIYYCPMHPQIRQNKPGTCPICSMDLVPLEEDKSGSTSEGKEGEGGVSEIGREVPEGLPAGLAEVRLSTWKEQLIGVRTAQVQKRSLKRIVRSPGRLAGGGFSALAASFAAGKPLPLSGGKHLIADVYALDLPYVRLGQKALVSGLMTQGEKIPGKIIRIYPYDETQSRVVRVGIQLEKEAALGPFANVEIYAETEPRLSVPRDSVLDSGLEHYAFVAKGGGRMEPRRITLGFLGEEFWEVRDGLEQGEHVVEGAAFFVEAESRLKAVLMGMSRTGGGETSSTTHSHAH